MPVDKKALANLRDAWMAAWPNSLAAWSRFTRLHPPSLCLTPQEAKKEGLSGSFAMIRLQDQSIIVSLPAVIDHGLESYAVEILAHEIGHHILAPANLTDHARLIARMRWSLPTVETCAPLAANLYTDLLINDRLQRSESLRLGEIYRKLGAKGDGQGAVWTLYMRIYELLWSLERGSLGGGKTDDRVEGDAWLGTRLLRSYARDWLDGSGRFAALLLPYLLEDKKAAEQLQSWNDTQQAGAGGCPDGLVDEDAGERKGAIHPASDPDLADIPVEEQEDSTRSAGKPIRDRVPHRGQSGQTREPFQYGEILRAAGVTLSDHDIAVRYYRERARPYLVPFPSQVVPESADPIPEGLEPWDIGEPLDNADWMQTVLQSPKVIPGMTTVQRVWGTAEGHTPERIPLDLDLYVDSSGSMPNPQHNTSYPALAGAILCLSALRAGARVQVTLWSGKNQFASTDGFVRDETAALRVLTGFFGGATAFPIHKLRDTYANRRKDARPAHIMVLSDDGVTTMFDKDEQGDNGWDIAALALAKAQGGGSLALNLPNGWKTMSNRHQAYGDLLIAEKEQGWQIHSVSTLEGLIAFARDFSRRRYGMVSAPTSANSSQQGPWRRQP